MKKLFFIMVLSVFFILGCTLEYDIMTITNKSATKTVSYTMYYDEGTFNLNPGENREHEVPCNSHLGPQTFSVTSGPLSVWKKMVNGLAYEFIDIPPMALSIANTLPVEVTISTGPIQYMSSVSITIDANDIDTGESIFTKENKFVIEDSKGYPAEAVSVYNSVENRIYVTIR